MVRVDRIQTLLKARNMNYTDLANATGMIPQVVNRYCNGTTKAIPYDRLAAIARALGTTPEYLAGNDYEDPRTQEERELLAAYYSLTPENKVLIDSLLDRLLSSQKTSK